jgi:heme/copper-type cytochrome/quinol oxidase subunit 2
MAGMNAFVFVPPAIAAFVFLVMGVVCWSYRDVDKRHEKPGATDHHDAHAGH